MRMLLLQSIVVEEVEKLVKKCQFVDLFISVEAKLSFVEPSRRWAHSPSPSKAPGISYQGTMKTSVMMLITSLLITSGGL